ncbi:CRISPR-associated endoribonuclease Cas6 [Paratractidigestivibacter sp.]|nr:CRISPR-associated endoribonuclease Cas6 [Paratractidigestivibacter sp.]
MEHISTLSLHLEPPKDFDVRRLDACSLGPMLQSVLLDNADAAYAAHMHETGFNPYSQYCYKDVDGGIVWRVSTLNDEASLRLIVPARRIEGFRLRNLDTVFTVSKQVCETESLSCLLGKLEGGEDSSFRVQLVTPTAFKSKNRYVIMPDVRLIFQNLLMRYNQVYSGEGEADPETISYIAEHTSITSYNLRSHYFPRTMGARDKIPAFEGTMTIHISGPQSLRGLVSMLLSFGEVAGVGIKTAMGMGGMRLLPTGQRRGTTKLGGSVG